MSKAIAKREPTEIVVIPDYLKTQVGNQAGTEGMGQNDLIMPRLSIAQSLSPQLKKQNENFIEGLAVGDMFNTMSGEVYGTEIKVVPLFFFTSFIEFKPISEGGGVIKMYQSIVDVPPADLQFTQDAVSGEQVRPKVTEFKNWMSLIIQEGRKPEPVIISFKSSGLKDCKKWNSFIRMTNLPAYAKVYTVESIHKNKGNLDWEGLKVTPGPFVPEAFFAEAEGYFNSLKDAGVKMDTTGLGDEEREERTSPF